MKLLSCRVTTSLGMPAPSISILLNMSIKYALPIWSQCNSFHYAITASYSVIGLTGHVTWQPWKFISGLLGSTSLSHPFPASDVLR